VCLRGFVFFVSLSLSANFFLPLCLSACLFLLSLSLIYKHPTITLSHSRCNTSTRPHTLALSHWYVHLLDTASTRVHVCVRESVCNLHTASTRLPVCRHPHGFMCVGIHTASCVLASTRLLPLRRRQGYGCLLYLFHNTLTLHVCVWICV